MDDDDVCQVCHDRPATWLDNPPLGVWRVVCDRCDVIPEPGVLYFEGDPDFLSRVLGSLPPHPPTD